MILNINRRKFVKDMTTGAVALSVAPTLLSRTYAMKAASKDIELKWGLSVDNFGADPSEPNKLGKISNRYTY